MARPTIDGSLPNRVFQRRSLITTTDPAVHGVVGGERDTQDRTDSEHIKKLPRDRLTGNPHGLAAAGQRPAASRNRRHRRERLLLLAPVEKIERGHAVVREARRPLPEHHEAIGFSEGEGTQEGRVDEAEHRAVGADADGEHSDRDEGEAGSAPQGAGGVAQVAPEGHTA